MSSSMKTASVYRNIMSSRGHYVPINWGWLNRLQFQESIKVLLSEKGFGVLISDFKQNWNFTDFHRIYNSLEYTGWMNMFCDNKILFYSINCIVSALLND